LIARLFVKSGAARGSLLAGGAKKREKSRIGEGEILNTNSFP
jgi:hypothetical protein